MKHLRDLFQSSGITLHASDDIEGRSDNYKIIFNFVNFFMFVYIFKIFSWMSKKINFNFNFLNQLFFEI